MTNYKPPQSFVSGNILVQAAPQISIKVLQIDINLVTTTKTLTQEDLSNYQVPSGKKFIIISLGITHNNTSSLHYIYQGDTAGAGTVLKATYRTHAIDTLDWFPVNFTIAATKFIVFKSVSAVTHHVYLTGYETNE